MAILTTRNGDERPVETKLRGKLQLFTTNRSTTVSMDT